MGFILHLDIIAKDTYHIDRGNGFEKKWFQKQNARRRTGQQGHDWSVEDM